MLDKLKSQWALLSPKNKTFTIWGGVFLFIAIAIFGFSNKPIKKVNSTEVKSEQGLFAVDDQQVTVEALGTKTKALEQQIDLLKQQVSSTNTQLLKAKEVINSLTGSDSNVRTLNELSKKIQRVDEKLDDYEIKRQYYNSGESKSSNIISDDDLTASSDKTTLSNDATIKKQTNEVVTQNLIDNSVKKEKIPEDPLSFIKQVQSHHNQSNTKITTIMSPEDSGVASTRQTNQQQVRKIEFISSSEPVKDAESDQIASKYVGSRILAGSLIPVVVVTGVDAPTGKAAEQGAISSTLRITGPAILPNGNRVDLTGCFVTTVVKGDSATERAFFRPDRLTCQYDYGDVDVPIKGYVSGKDGVDGFRGRLVSKQGKALIYGTIAGGVKGIGKAFGGGNSSQSLITGGVDPFHYHQRHRLLVQVHLVEFQMVQIF
jgi:hypothetical protein